MGPSRWENVTLKWESVAPFVCREEEDSLVECECSSESMTVYECLKRVLFTLNKRLGVIRVKATKSIC